MLLYQQQQQFDPSDVLLGCQPKSWYHNTRSTDNVHNQLRANILSCHRVNSYPHVVEIHTKIRPSLIIAYRAADISEMRWIFGSQDRTDIIGWTALTMKHEYYTDCFFYIQFSRKTITTAIARLRTFTHEFAAPEYLSAHSDEAL